MALINSNPNSIQDVTVTSSSGESVNSNVKFSLIQDFGKWYRIIPSSCRLVQESILGDKITIQRPGLAFINPLKRCKLVCVSSFKMNIDFEDSLNNIDNLELTVKPVIVHYHVTTNSFRDRQNGRFISGVEKFYRERTNAIELIKDDIRTLITLVVSKSHYPSLKGLILTLGQIPESYRRSFGEAGMMDADDIQLRINQVITDIRLKYGIEIDKIKISDVNLPAIITNAQAEAEKQAIQNETNKKKAEADRDVAMLNAEAQRYIESVRYDVLFSYARANNLSQDAIERILRLQALRDSNATIIESCGGLDSLVALLMSQFFSRYGGNPGYWNGSRYGNNSLGYDIVDTYTNDGQNYSDGRVL